MTENHSKKRETEMTVTNPLKFTVSQEVVFPFRATVIYPDNERGNDEPIAFCVEIEEAERIADALNSVLEVY